MMVRKQLGVSGAFVSMLAATVMTLSACSSGGSGGSTESAPSSSDVSPASVAPGVEKDSVLDLNSTKDMTGVVTTVPIGKSPYDKNMPDICNFVTPQAMAQLKVETKKKGFYGSPLIYQNCQLTPAPSFTDNVVVAAGIYVNNLREHLSDPALKKVSPDPTPLFLDVVGYLVQDADLNRGGRQTSCEVAWGTFYGTAVVTVDDFNAGTDTCDRAVAAAKVLGPLMPKSPSQMRATS